MNDSELWAIVVRAHPPLLPESGEPTRSVTVCRAQGGVPDSEGPTFYSREEVWRFVGELREAADRVWPES